MAEENSDLGGNGGPNGPSEPNGPSGIESDAPNNSNGPKGPGNGENGDSPWVWQTTTVGPGGVYSGELPLQPEEKKRGARKLPDKEQLEKWVNMVKTPLSDGASDSEKRKREEAEAKLAGLIKENVDENVLQDVDQDLEDGSEEKKKTALERLKGVFAGVVTTALADEIVEHIAWAYVEKRIRDKQATKPEEETEEKLSKRKQFERELRERTLRHTEELVKSDRGKEVMAEIRKEIEGEPDRSMFYLIQNRLKDLEKSCSIEELAKIRSDSYDRNDARMVQLANEVKVLRRELRAVRNGILVSARENAHLWEKLEDTISDKQHADPVAMKTTEEWILGIDAENAENEEAEMKSNPFWAKDFGGIIPNRIKTVLIQMRLSELRATSQTNTDEYKQKENQIWLWGFDDPPADLDNLYLKYIGSQEIKTGKDIGKMSFLEAKTERDRLGLEPNRQPLDDVRMNQADARMKALTEEMENSGQLKSTVTDAVNTMGELQALSRQTNVTEQQLDAVLRKVERKLKEMRDITEGEPEESLYRGIKEDVFVRFVTPSLKRVRQIQPVAAQPPHQQTLSPNDEAVPIRRVDVIKANEEYMRFLRDEKWCMSIYSRDFRENEYYKSLQTDVEREYFEARARLQNAVNIKQRYVNSLSTVKSILGACSVDPASETADEVSNLDIALLMQQNPYAEEAFRDYGKLVWENKHQFSRKNDKGQTERYSLLESKGHREIDQYRTSIQQKLKQQLMSDGYSEEDATLKAMESEHIAYNTHKIYLTFDDDSVWVDAGSKEDRRTSINGIAITKIRKKGFSTDATSHGLMFNLPLRNQLHPIDALLTRVTGVVEKETEYGAFEEWGVKQTRLSLAGKHYEKYEEMPEKFTAGFDFDEVVVIDDRKMNWMNQGKYEETFWKAEKYKEKGVEKYRVYVPACYPVEQLGSYTAKSGLKEKILKNQDIDWEGLPSFGAYRTDAGYYGEFWDLYQPGGGEAGRGAWVDEVTKTRLGQVKQKGNKWKMKWLYYAKEGVDPRYRAPHINIHYVERMPNKTAFFKSFLPEKELFFPWDVKERNRVRKKIHRF